MSKMNQFNSNNTEYVTQDVRQQGEFNILHGSTGLLPSQLQTAQGSNGIDTPEGTTFENLSEPVNPHGILVRNTNNPSLYPENTAAVNSLSLADTQKQVRVGLDNFGTSLDGTSEVTITAVTRDTLSFPTNQDLAADNVIPSVGSRFFR